MEIVLPDLECAVLLCKLYSKFFLTYWHSTGYFTNIFEFHYLQIEYMWKQCYSKHHIHSESKLSNWLYYNWNLRVFGYSRIIRYYLNDNWINEINVCMKKGLLDPVLKATQEPLKFSTKLFCLITFKINCWSFVNFLDICQLRLDFDNFDLVETTTGVCTDSLTISGPTGRNPMDLCGTLTGFHGK